MAKHISIVEKVTIGIFAPGIGTQVFNDSLAETIVSHSYDAAKKIFRLSTDENHSGARVDRIFYDVSVCISTVKELSCKHPYKHVRFMDNGHAGETVHCEVCEPNWNE